MAQPCGTNRAPRAVNQAGGRGVLHSSLRRIEEGALGMGGWLLIGLSAASMGTITPPAQLAQADVTTPAYAATPMEPWYGYKLRLAALARRQGVREDTIQANVMALTVNQRVIELERTEPVARSSGGVVGALSPHLRSHVTPSLVARGRTNYSTLYDGLRSIEGRYG